MPHNNLLEIYDGRSAFWQWDTGQKLRVLDKTIDQVHFSNKDLTYAIVKEVYVDDDGVRACDVPDVLLKLSNPLIAYAYVMDIDANRTICSVRFSVTSRQIPEDYTYEEDNRFKDLVDKIESIEDILNSGTGSIRFNSMSAAKKWAEESQEAGALVSVFSGTQWLAYIVNYDFSLSPINGDNDNIDLSEYLTEEKAAEVYQPKGNYASIEYVNNLFEELKALIQDTDGGEKVEIVVLDNAILDMHILA